MMMSRSALAIAPDLVVPAKSGSGPAPIEEALQQALTQSVEAKVETRLSTLLEGIGDAFYSLSQDWCFTYINKAAETYFGLPREEMLGRNIWEIFPGSEGTGLRRQYEEVFASGRSASFEAEAVGVAGRFLELHVFPYNEGLGISFRDWTERRRAEEELRESEARLSSLADNVPGCMVYQLSDTCEYQDRKLIYLSKTCEQLTGVPAEDVQASPALLYNLVLPQYRERMLAEEYACYRERKAFTFEFEIVHAKTGEVRWHRVTITPRQMPNGYYVWDGLQLDITDHKRAEEHLRLLINELNHRVKNTLATVQSLAAQSFHRPSFRHKEELTAARSAFEARLFALARGHDVLTRENWESANLTDLIAQACAPYRGDPEEAKRIETDGPELRIAPPMALSLSMALHELSTNALKYGALSVPAGQVLISWKTMTCSTGQRLILRWEERGGPPVAAPTRKGFGSRLIQDGLARELSGVVQIVYEPSGVVCTIDVPLP
ncbi:HWE histidine kinase domain-containing protein [Microvirga sp. 2YAF29]|uniref:PAS domain-containing sensor histidine kinase n=1 Tax=Microvirga sp. 2YAF29 TaxID=3233031 RepID=UPI003F992872